MPIGSRLLPVLTLIGFLAGVSPPARAATNAALGGIGGLNNGTLSGGDGTGTALISIDAVGLPLVKRARDLAGSLLPDGGSAAAGQVIYFVITVENPTNYPAQDIQVSDLLDESQFTYLSGTLETTTVRAGSSDGVLWAATWRPVPDEGGGQNLATFADSGGPPGRDRLTLGAVPEQPNATLKLPGRTTLAIRFRVMVR